MTKPRGIDLRREFSDQIVLDVILDTGRITRPEIARRSGLSKPTVSEIVRHLLKSGLVRDDGIRTGSPGRTPTFYVPNEEAGFVIGVDIGGEQLRLAAANLFGEIIAEETQPIEPDGQSAQRQLEVHISAISKARPRSRLFALALSSAKNASQNGELSLVDLRERLGVPVIVDSPVNFAAIGEKWRGLAVNVSNFVFLSIGERVGMGIVLNDELLSGSHGKAGGIFDLQSFTFGTVNRESTIPYSFGDSVRAAAVATSIESRKDWIHGIPSSIEDAFVRAEHEPAAREILREEAARIAPIIAVTSALFDPSLIVLGGRLGASPQLLQPVRELVASLFPRSAPIETSSLHERAAVFGALAVALKTARSEVFRLARRSEKKGPATK